MSKTTVDCLELAKRFLERRCVIHGCRTVHFWQESYWIWEHGIYRELSQRDLDDRIHRWLQNDVENNLRTVWEWTCQNVHSILRTERPPRNNCWLPPAEDEAPYPGEADDDWLQLKSGLFNVSEYIRSGSAVIRPLTPRYFSQVRLPYDFDPKAECPVWEKAVAEWMQGDPDLIGLLQEISGYLLSTSLQLQVGFFLEGEGANGKTAYCEAMMDMLGRENYSAVPLSDFNQRFALCNTIGRLVNFSTETNARKPIPAEVLKQFVSGDAMTMDRKYMSGITVEPTARLVIAWNKRPQVDDVSEGFWRRIVIVPFSYFIPVERRDPGLRRKFQVEMPGILRWALEGRKRLLLRGRLPLVAASQSVVEEFRAQSDTVRAYRDARLRRESGGELRKSVIYADYLSWCEDRAYTAKDTGSFFKRILELLPDVATVRIREDERRVAVLKGVVFNHAEGNEC